MKSLPRLLSVLFFALSLSACGIQKLGKASDSSLASGAGDKGPADNNGDSQDNTNNNDPNVVAGAVPVVTFPDDGVNEWDIKSSDPIPFNVVGPRDPKFDVVIQIWSNSEMRLVLDGARGLNAAPWQFDASYLAQVPLGSAQLQVLVRVDNQVQSIVHKDITIVNK
jgi:hypothetical protein